jgi:hypothetical protein
MLGSGHLWYWREIAERRRQQNKRTAPPRRLAVPPGAFKLALGEEKLITNGAGERLIVHAVAEAVSHKRGK